jgi:hypothetical protein
MLRAFISVLLASLCPTILYAQVPVPPGLPRVSVDVSMPDTTGYTVVQVNAGGDLQGAINSASCSPNGTIIKVQAGATFAGAFTLPVKVCASGKRVIIRSDAPDANLPAFGVRISPAYAPFLPKIVANQTNWAGFHADINVQNYRLMFLWVTVPGLGVYGSNDSAAGLIELGNGGFGGPQNTAASQPRNMIVDRCLIRGSDNPPIGIRRGVEMHCAYCAVVNSYIDQIHEIGIDSQAIGGWNSTGPWLIENNYLSAAAENIVMGGADVNIPNALPSDVTIRRNHLFKPYSWKVGDPSYAGTPWLIKNLLEIKLGVRVLVEGNVLENVWPSAQDGSAIAMFGSNSSGNTTWAIDSDITVRYNEFINAEAGVGGTSSGWNGHPSLQSNRVLWNDNVAWGITDPQNVTFSTGPALNLQFIHNTAHTAVQGKNFLMVDAQAATPQLTGATQPLAGFAFNNNIVYVGRYGESSRCTVNGAYQDCYTASQFNKNLVYGMTATSGASWCSSTGPSIWVPNGIACPSGTTGSVGDVSFVQFVDPINHDYHLKATSPGHHVATEGKDVGADIDAVNAATAGVVKR